MPTSFSEILLSFEFVSSDASHQAFLCKQTGKIYLRSDLSELDELNDELPDDVEDDEKYVAKAFTRADQTRVRVHFALAISSRLLPP